MDIYTTNVNWNLWNLTYTNIVDITLPESSGHNIGFTPDSKYIFCSDKLWNAENGNFIKKINGRALPKIEKVKDNSFFIMENSISFKRFSYDDNFYEDIFLDKEKLENLNEYEETEYIDTNLFNDSRYVEKSLSNDLRFICMTSIDTGSVLLSCTKWGRKDGNKKKPICQISVFENDEWMAITPDGFFNSSPNGENYLRIRYNLDIFNLNQFTKSYYQPEVLVARTNDEKDPNCVEYYGNILLASPPPIVKLEKGRINNNILPLKIVIINRKKEKINDIAIYRNGKYLGSTVNRYKESLTNIASDSIELNVDISLDNGDNYVEVLANTDFCYGIATITTEYDCEYDNASNLYVLSIGINKYSYINGKSDIGLSNLKYAVQDSKNITNLFNTKKLSYKNVYIREINDDAFIKPYRDEILGNMSFFSNMNENDVGVIFIASHGITAEGKFYLLPNDFMYSDNKIADYSTAISIDEIMNRLSFLGRKIVLLDSCMSGGVQNNYIVKTLQNKSVAILTASQEDELAQENIKQGGYFTYSIVSYFEENEIDNYSLSDMTKYIYDEVREMSRFEKRGRIKQNPAFFIPEGFSNFYF